MTQFKLKADLIELASYEEKVEFIQERLVANFNGWIDVTVPDLVKQIKEEFGIEMTKKQFSEDVLTDKIMDKLIVNFISDARSK